jgi:hypothetical protein
MIVRGRHLIYALPTQWCHASAWCPDGVVSKYGKLPHQKLSQRLGILDVRNAVAVGIGVYEDRYQTHGYAATREATMLPLAHPHGQVPLGGLGTASCAPCDVTQYDPDAR